MTRATPTAATTAARRTPLGIASKPTFLGTIPCPTGRAWRSRFRTAGACSVGGKGESLSLRPDRPVKPMARAPITQDVDQDAGKARGSQAGPARPQQDGAATAEQQATELLGQPMDWAA